MQKGYVEMEKFVDATLKKIVASQKYEKIYAAYKYDMHLFMHEAKIRSMFFDSSS